MAYTVFYSMTKKSRVNYHCYTNHKPKVKSIFQKKRDIYHTNKVFARKQQLKYIISNKTTIK